jgi:protein-arginine kinase activator protein McsA
MSKPSRCDKCEGTKFSLLLSKIEGLNKVIDIFLCTNCKANKIVVTSKEKNIVVDTPTNTDNYVDFDGDVDYEEVAQEPENPYEDDDGGWDPNIG